MINATLTRRETSDKGTFGEFCIVDEVICYTLELPWLDNQRGESCIPAGKYIVTPWVSPAHGKCFKIWNVPGRDDILIHVGNFLRDTLGCVLVGEGATNDMVQHSVKALNKLKRLIGDQAFEMTIIESYTKAT